MNDVGVVIFHPEPAADAGPLTQVVAAARRRLAEIHRAGFERAGAASIRIVRGPPDGRSFGARLRELALHGPDGGLIVLGSGAVPLATPGDRRRFVEVAASDRAVALTNNAYSADIVAIACARETLARVPDLATDNALPRWLGEVAGVHVDDLRGRWRLGVDIDGPLDLVLLGTRWSAGLASADGARVTTRLDAVRAVLADARGEVVVAGRTSPDALTRLARASAARTRALIEERGMRTSVAGQRPPASVLGALLERDGPSSLGAVLARLGDAAIVDSRVLLAHRLGADARTWPADEDRFGSDLLLDDRIADPWLRDLTRSAAEAPIPILLGGHSLVGPGLSLVVRR